MPTISRTFVKAGMIYFALSLLTGLVIEIDISALPALTPLFWHMLMVGWITQIIMGVSIWMFPGRNREEGFAAQKWGWLTFILLNTGLVLRIIAEPMAVGPASLLWNMMLVFSALAQFTAGITYLIEMWPRIMSKKQQREKREKKRRDR